MARENTVELKLKSDARSLVKGLNKSERRLRSFSGKAKRMLSGVGRGLRRGLTSLPAQLGFAGVAAGLVVAGKQVVDFDSKLTRFAIQSKITRAEQTKLREQIHKTALATGQSQNDILEGMDAIVQRTGNFVMAKEAILGIGYAATATGARTGDLGALASQLAQKFKLSGDSIFNALGILTAQGKEGAFTLENLGGLSDRLFASAGRLDMTGIEDFRKIGAFAQIARMGTGSSEQATTAVERTLANILAKQKQIKKYGFDIRDDKGNIKKLDEILKGVIRTTKGDEEILGRLFGEEGIRAVSVLAKMYRDTNGFDLFDKLIKVNGDVLMKDFARYAESSWFQFHRLKIIGSKIADTALAEPIKELADWLGKITKDDEKMEALAEHFRELGRSIGWVAKKYGELEKKWGFEKHGFDILGWIADKRLQNIKSQIKAEIRQKMGLETGLSEPSEIVKDNAFYVQKVKQYSDKIKKARQAKITEQQSNPVSVNNRIKVNINVDKEGKLKEASVVSTPQKGVASTTFLDDVFVHGATK